MSFTFAVRHVNGVAIADISGRLTLASSGDNLSRSIVGLFEDGDRKILLNLRNISAIDSMGIGELVGSYAAVSRRGGAIKFVGASPRLQELLSVTRLDTIFDLWQDEASALASFGKP